jgi:hypothetical protein
VKIADFDGDGHLDFAAANYLSDNVGVWLGDGTGDFHSQTVSPAGEIPLALAVADFDGDGVEDLGVTNGGFNGYVSVLLGNGDGSFEAPLSTPVLGAQPNSMVSGDFNGDGRPDLAATRFVGNSVVVLLGNGDGTMSVGATYPVGTKPYRLAAGDFNADGAPDLAVPSTETQGTVMILRGNGDGTFQHTGRYRVGKNAYSAAAGDLNGDGREDLAVTAVGSGLVRVFLGNGDGTFQKKDDYPAGPTPSSVVVADFNRDRILDLAVVDNADDTFSVLLGNGDGSFQAPQSYGTCFLAVNYGMSVGDFNEDGWPDVAVANGRGLVSVQLNDGVWIVPIPPPPTVSPATERLLSAKPVPLPVVPADPDAPAAALANPDVTMGAESRTSTIETRHPLLSRPTAQEMPAPWDDPLWDALNS